MPSPIDEYLDNKTAAQQQRKDEELALWHKWKNNGERPEDLHPLLQRYEPVFATKIREWKPKNFPTSAFKAELQKQTIRAFQTFDPERGAALNTHVYYYLPKALRYGNQGANLAYIPEGKKSKIKTLQRAKDDLRDELGREPSAEEVGDRVGMPTPKVEEIFRAMRGAVPMSRSGGSEEGTGYDYSSGLPNNRSSFEQQQLGFIAGSLHTIFPNKPDTHAVFNHLFGTNGYDTISSTRELAQKLGKNESQISRIKKHIATTIRPYLQPQAPTSKK